MYNVSEARLTLIRLTNGDLSKKYEALKVLEGKLTTIVEELLGKKLHVTLSYLESGPIASIDLRDGTYGGHREIKLPIEYDPGLDMFRGSNLDSEVHNPIPGEEITKKVDALVEVAALVGAEVRVLLGNLSNSRGY
jgi:hypothetical protein